MPAGPLSASLADGPRVLLSGAHGLVGGRVLDRLLAAGLEVLAPTRRPLDRTHAGLVNPVFDGARALQARDGSLKRLLQGERAQVWICALGTTQAKAGNPAAFVAVDRDLVLRFAGIARQMGARHAILVSSVGAHPNARSFYLRIKAEAERGLAERNFPRVDILRPGLLLGTREEQRPAEDVAKHLMPLLNPLLLGPLARWRAIPADTVADAAVSFARGGGSGWFVHEYTAMIEAAKRG